ncbi:MAG: SDR family oxidoreductase [Deltaproteobacteria bacterium]|nr:SDR family oxidoreductase [Deltaproteobacteria bacterium]
MSAPAPALPPQDMTGKVCLVTGANSGIGLVTARELCARGAEVLMVCRSAEKGAEAAAEIEAATGRRPRLYLADLSDLAQVARVAREVKAEHARLDVLVNNAGGHFPRYMESAQGYELTFALNHLSYFLLTHHLLPLVEAAPAGRVVCVASRAHEKSALDLDDPFFKRRARLFQTPLVGAFLVYGTSKLLNVLFTRELARRLKARGSAVTVNALHPGVVRTGFGKDYGGLFNLAARALGLVSISPEQGARTSVYLATSPEVAGVSGGYFDKCREVQPSATARDPAQAARLWALSEGLCEGFM